MLSNNNALGILQLLLQSNGIYRSSEAATPITDFLAQYFAVGPTDDMGAGINMINQSRYSPANRQDCGVHTYTLNGYQPFNGKTESDGTLYSVLAPRIKDLMVAAGNNNEVMCLPTGLGGVSAKDLPGMDCKDLLPWINQEIERWSKRCEANSAIPALLGILLQGETDQLDPAGWLAAAEDYLVRFNKMVAKTEPGKKVQMVQYLPTYTYTGLWDAIDTFVANNSDQVFFGYGNSCQEQFDNIVAVSNATFAPDGAANPLFMDPTDVFSITEDQVHYKDLFQKVQAHESIPAIQTRLGL